MNSLIFSTVTRFVTPFLLVIAVFLLVRGHNSPGGGFTAGLVVTATLALYMMAFGEKAMKRALRLDPRTLAGIGLAVAVCSGIPAILENKPFLTALWFQLWTPFGPAKLGTPLLFDLGVFFVVVGVGVSLLEDMHEE